MESGYPSKLQARYKGENLDASGGCALSFCLPMRRVWAILASPHFKHTNAQSLPILCNGGTQSRIHVATPAGTGFSSL